MDEFLCDLTIIILIVVIVALTRKLRRFKRGSCSKTELRIGEGITFSHSSCVNPEAEKPPETLYSAPRQPTNAICPTCNPLATQMDGRSCQIGGIVGSDIDFLEERNRATSERYRLLLELNMLRAELQTPMTLEEKIQQAKDFLHDAQINCAKCNILIDANNTNQGGNQS